MTRITDLAYSVHVRLVAHAKEIGIEAQFMLERFALCRLLYRLSKSVYSKRFVLSLCWFCERTVAEYLP
jgi:hypothetical protein